MSDRNITFSLNITNNTFDVNENNKPRYVINGSYTNWTPGQYQNITVNNTQGINRTAPLNLTYFETTDEKNVTVMAYTSESFDYTGPPTCNVGHYKLQSYSTSCILCPCGTYQENPDLVSGSCTPCPAGTYDYHCWTTSNQGDAGKVLGATSRQQCWGCFQTDDGQPLYQPKAGSPEGCKFCLKGWQPTPLLSKTQTTHWAVGHTGCEQCAQPFYFNSDDNTCVECQTNNQVSSKAGVNCEPCPDGQYRDMNVKMHKCQDCKAGTYGQGVGGGCISCPIDQFNPNTGMKSSDSETCQKCPLSTYGGSQRQSKCTACIPGKYTDILGSVQINCKKCPAGKYRSAAMSNLDDSGTWDSECQICPVGTATGELEGAKSCPLTCKGGEQNSPQVESSVAPGERCVTCNAGYYSENGKHCKKCSLGKQPSSAGDKCNDCPYGQYGYILDEADGGGATCSQCPMEDDSNVHKNGQARKITEKVGSVSAQACVPCPGGWQCMNGKADFICPLNTYANNYDDYGNMYCGICPNGAYTTTTGNVDLSSCKVCDMGGGYGLVISPTNATQLNCQMCTPGRYNTGRGSTERRGVNEACKPCMQGSYTSVSGSLTCSACPEATYGKNEGGTSAESACVACPSGKWTTSDQMNPKTPRTACDGDCPISFLVTFFGVFYKKAEVEQCSGGSGNPLVRALMFTLAMSIMAIGIAAPFGIIYACFYTQEGWSATGKGCASIFKRFCSRCASIFKGKGGVTKEEDPPQLEPPTRFPSTPYKVKSQKDPPAYEPPTLPPPYEDTEGADKKEKNSLYGIARRAIFGSSYPSYTRVPQYSL